MTRLRICGVACLVFLAACGAPDSGLLPPPSSTASTSSTSSTIPVDYSRVALDAFPGDSTTTTPISEGSATVRGVVVGPEGAVVGATVRIERLIGDVVQRTDVGTDERGGFILQRVPGGRYRVRAYQAPRLTMMDVEIFFLDDGGDRELRLETEVFEGISVTGATTPDAPIVGQGVNLAIRVAQRSVDGDGVGREVPSVGVPVQVRTSGWTVLDRPAATTTTTSTTTTTTDPDGDTAGDPDEDDDDGADPTEVRVTDGDGVIVFQFACDRAGSTTATAVVGSGADEQSFSIEVPPCAPAPTTTTTVPGDAVTTTVP